MQKITLLEPNIFEPVKLIRSFYMGFCPLALNGRQMSTTNITQSHATFSWLQLPMRVHCPPNHHVPLVVG